MDHLPARQVAHSTGDLDRHVDQVLLGDGLEGSRTDRQTDGRERFQKAGRKSIRGLCNQLECSLNVMRIKHTRVAMSDQLIPFLPNKEEEGFWFIFTQMSRTVEK